MEVNDHAMNFAFMDGDLELCEELRQKGEVLEFSHNDIRQALLDGRHNIILWLRKWYKEHWELYCREYFPLPNAIMSGNVALAQLVWDEALVQPKEEKDFFDIARLGTQTPLRYALQSNNPEMMQWVERSYPNEKICNRDLFDAMHQNHEESILWVLENKSVQWGSDLLFYTIECLCEKVARKLATLVRLRNTKTLRMR
ncbi:conserved hypothetical protein [Lausannevirus]|uniref:Ankyrin repeat protein n=1 Tax=Lausannevirus TaxID=999883 RepID=F2WLU0_9VIRU|nr:hypothetical protein LAU_0363 [Lausannevirus]AEA07213.1 conserved hypothetical protein [Lausannevirus]